MVSDALSPLEQQIENDFTYHAPTEEQQRRHKAIRSEAKAFALTIVRFTPQSKEQDQALFLLNLAVMSANAAIARKK